MARPGAVWPGGVRRYEQEENNMANGQWNKRLELTAQQARQLARDRLEKVYVVPVIRKREFRYSRNSLQKYRKKA